METIPDDVLKAEWARRFAQKFGKLGGRPVSHDPQTEEKRKQQREYRRNRRAQGKDK